MSLEVDYGADTATFTVTRPNGMRVTFDVRKRRVKVGNGWPYSYSAKRYDDRWVVGLKGSDEDGFSQHLTYDRACQFALARARRYDRACSRARSAA